MSTELRIGIAAEAARLGIDPVDLATVISYETAGTYDPWKKGPRTQWGQHRGLIQWGEPQRAKYGVYEGMPVAEQLRKVSDYLTDAGVKPGMGIMDVYSAINAGAVGRYNASDANNGGAPGTVADKVNNQMGGHRQKAIALMGGEFTAPNSTVSGTKISYNPAQDATKAARGFPAETDDQFDSIGEMFGASMDMDWVGSWLYDRAAGDNHFDPDWNLTEDTLKEAAQGLPTSYFDFIAEAQNQTEFESRVAQANEWMKMEQKFEEAGVTGTGVRLLMSVMDPTMIAAAVATEGVAAPAVLAFKGTRLTRLLTTSALTAMEGGGVAALQDELTPDDLEPADYFAAMAIAGAIGGTVSGVLSGRNVKEAQATQNLMDEMHNAGTSAGAARSDEIDMLSSGDLPFFTDDSSVSKTFAGKGRFDTAARFGSSEDPLERLVGTHLVEDAAGRQGGDAVPASIVSTDAAVLHQQAQRDWLTVAGPSFDEWRKETYGRNKWNALSRQSDLEEFNRLVYQLVEDPTPAADTSRHLARTAQEYRKIMQRYAELINNPLAERGGVARPLGNVKYDELYAPKYANRRAIVEAFQNFRPEQLENLVKEAVRRRVGTALSQEVQHKIATGYIKSMRNVGFGLENPIERAVREVDKDALKDAFEKHGVKLSDEEMDQVMNTVDDLADDVAAKQDGGKGRHLKRRTLLDYRYRPEMVDKTGKLRPFGVNDFFTQDADMTLTRYSRQMSGRVALGRMQITHPETGEMIVDGITKQGEWDKLVNMIAESRASRGLTDHETMKSEMGYIWDALTGTPHFNNDSQVYDWMRRMRMFNFVRLMNRMGITQSMEFSRALGGLGVKAMVQQMPTFRRIVQNGRSIPNRDALLEELEAATGLGVELKMGPMRSRYHDDMIGSKHINRLDTMLQQGQNITANYSLFNFTMGTQQRWVMKAATQKIANILDGVSDISKLPARLQRKMNTLGMDKDVLARVGREINKHAERPDGKRIHQLNLEEWDPMTRDEFIQGLTRWSDRIIMRNDIGNLNRWFSNPFVQLLMQFRVFLSNMWAKGALYNMNHMDAQTLGTMAAEIFFGTATYAMQTAALTAGNDKLWEEKMQWDNLVLNGAARAAFMSMIPGAIDSALGSTGFGTVFSDYRGSGSASDFLFGNPTVGLMDNFRTAASALNKSISGEKDWEPETLGKAARVLPFGNFLPFTTILNSMTD